MRDAKRGELSSPILLDREQCLKYKKRLSDFYYSNMLLCSYLDGFSYKDAEQKIESLIEYVSNGSAMVFGVFDDENLIGFVWAYEHPFREETRMYVNEIHVDKAYRRRGVGKQLLSAVECKARERGYNAVYLHAEGNNDSSLRFYQSERYVIERVQFRKDL